MRDLILTAVVFAGLPLMLKHPYIGVYYWTWLGLMNPQRLTWGFAYNFPYSMLVAMATLLALVWSRDPKPMKGGGLTVLMMVFTAWMSFTTIFAFHPDDAYILWVRVIKIQLMTWVAIMVLNNRKQLHVFVWIIVFSLGFYGTKGGIFTIATGGSYRVWGPANSFIEDNNAMATTMVMLIPLIYYLVTQTSNKWIKRGLVASAMLCAFSALGSQSRGALVAIAAMTGMFWLKNKKSPLIAVMLLIAIPVMINFMPDSWTSRMKTIQTYDKDASSMGRINAWYMAFNIAKDRPIGGGFELAFPDTFAKYAPDPLDIHVAHSIYFEVLGEHGFIGLALFLAIWFVGWRRASSIIKLTRHEPEFEWARSLAAMVQTSLLGYLVGGAFLNLAYFDLPYYLLVILIVSQKVIREELAARSLVSSPNGSPPGAPFVPGRPVPQHPGRPFALPAERRPGTLQNRKP
ncbi:MAG: putative O-glycosylation ligase, exosortase A system-associated [Rhodocyclaceae bacterium]|nr:putative O-glycosylation ligase, exosortase A system-associated [Rhodocyclaceae bacterium]